VLLVGQMRFRTMLPPLDAMGPCLHNVHSIWSSARPWRALSLPFSDIFVSSGKRMRFFLYRPDWKSSGPSATLSTTHLSAMCFLTNLSYTRLYFVGKIHSSDGRRDWFAHLLKRVRITDIRMCYVCEAGGHHGRHAVRDLGIST
jgi:hypothetical protein